MMSTDTIPDEKDVKRAYQGIPNYRFADGKILVGREQDGTLEQREAIVGILKRVGYHEGTTDTGETYGKVEAEIETKAGPVSISANRTSRMAVKTFVEGLMAVEKGQLVSIRAGASKERNRYGKLTTYANVYTLNEKFEEKAAKAVVIDKGVSIEDIVPLSIEALKTHPAFAERPRRAADSDEVNDLAAEILGLIAKGGKWPNPIKYEKEYLDFCGKVALKIGGVQETYGGWDEVPEAVLHELKTGHETGKVPKALQALPIDAVVSDDEYDPFADE